MGNITETLGKNRCSSCGMCYSVCPKNCIDVIYNKKQGFYYPAVNEKLCINCGKCLSCCPSNYEKTESYVGNYQEILLAHSTDNRVRHEATSGGVVNSLVSYAVKNHILDVVLMVVKDDSSPIGSSAVGITIDNIERLSSSPRDFASRYVSVPVLKELKALKSKYKKIGVVGTPCQIRAVKSFDKSIFTFGITCSGVISYNATQQYKKIQKKEEAAMYYRGNGWPGYNSLCDKENCVDCKHLGSYFERMFSSQIFKSPACRECADHFAELADISFCDYWSAEELKNEKEGNTCVIVRTEAGKQLLENSLRSEKIELVQKLSEEQLINSQKSVLRAKKDSDKNAAEYRLFYRFIDFIFKHKIYKIFNKKIYNKFAWIHSKVIDKSINK